MPPVQQTRMPNAKNVLWPKGSAEPAQPRGVNCACLGRGVLVFLRTKEPCGGLRVSELRGPVRGQPSSKAAATQTISLGTVVSPHGWEGSGICRAKPLLPVLEEPPESFGLFFRPSPIASTRRSRALAASPKPLGP